MLVAMPTAMPAEPLISRLGTLRGQHLRLALGFVVVRHEIDGLAVQVGQQFVREARHAHLGVTHGGGGVAVDRAEVALPVHQHVTHGEGLGHADDGVVDRRIAVRVVLADHVTDHAGGFLVGLVPLVAEHVHGEQDPAVHRLQTVPNIGQRAPDDDAHRVVQVGLAHFVFEVYLQYFFGEFSHTGI
jgi:hypothetical protein